jgi:hypothetical protein
MQSLAVFGAVGSSGMTPHRQALNSVSGTQGNSMVPLYLPPSSVSVSSSTVVRLIERRKQLPSELPLLLGEPEMGYGELQS